MATVVNERDVLMQLTIPRFQITSQVKTMLLSADSPVFRVATDGSGLPASVHVTADLLNIAGTVNFTVDSGSTISVAGNVATLTFANMTTPTTTIHASVTENGITYLRDYIINKVVDGAIAQLLVLDVPTQNFKFNNVGVAAPTGQSISFTALLKNITGTSVFSCTLYDVAGTNLGAVTLGGTGNIRTLTVAQFGAAAYATVTATLGSLTDTCTVVRLQDGVSALAGYLTNELQGVPSNADGSGADFTGASGSFKVFLGTTDVTSAALYSIVGSPLVTGSINSTTGAYSVTAVGTWANASKLTNITFRATYAGVTIDKVFSLNKIPAGVQGTNGIRGNVNIAANGYAAWSDASAVSVIAAAGFGAVQNQDIVTLFDATNSVTKFYNTGVWSVLTAYINGNLLVDGTVAAKSLNIGIGGRNLCDNSGPTPGNSRGYFIGSNTTGQANPVINPTNPNWCPVGANAGYITFAATIASGATAVVKTQATGTYMSASAGLRYEASVYLSMHRCIGRVVINFLNSSQVFISSFGGNSIGSYGASGAGGVGVTPATYLDVFPRSVVFATAPAGTAYVQMYIETAYGGGATPYTFWSGLYFGEALPNQTIPSPWTDCQTTTIDGAGIKTSSILATSMSVTDLSAISANLGSIQVDTLHIGANQVTIPLYAKYSMENIPATPYAYAGPYRATSAAVYDGITTVQLLLMLGPIWSQYDTAASSVTLLFQLTRHTGAATLQIDGGTRVLNRQPYEHADFSPVCAFDTPPAGTHYYSARVQIDYTGIEEPRGGVIVVFPYTLLLTGFKR